MNEELIATVRGARFTPTRIREGYEMGQVDRLLDEVCAALEVGSGVGDLVSGARFNPVRLREAYDMGEVDEFLDMIIARAELAPQAADSHDPVAPASTPASTPASAPAATSAAAPVAEPSPTAVQEQRGLLSRLFGRG